jgi:hypothetical protein
MDNDADEFKNLVEAAKKRLAEHDQAASEIPWLREMLKEAFKEIRKLEVRVTFLEGKSQ